MGEVYRARDTRLDRTVAIKVLPAHLSSDPDLKQRMEREAKAISSLNHPHICTLHDIGSQDGTNFLVMEYLEGETLADRLRKGPLPLEEALRIAIQIAEALDKAHARGIVHRDLKPANVMLTKNGPKLMDFGLAKAAPGTTSASGSGPHTPSTPTMTVAALSASASPLTQKGTVVGTFQYMAPEVLQGAEADARSDIFSFGCMLYEMITGRRAFEGKSQFSVLGAILDQDPSQVSAVRPSSPARLDETVRTCLAKNPEQRYGCMHDVRIQLEGLAGGTAVSPVTSGAAAPRSSDSRLPWAIAGVAALIAVAAAAAYWLQPAKPAAVLRSSILPPAGTSFITMSPASGPPVLSPDGTRIAFTARDEKSKVQIYVRALSSLTAQPLAGTDNAIYPFWSPDSRELGFFADGKLKRINASGGPPENICDSVSGRGGTWSKDGVIIFTPSSNSPLFRVPASGGQPVAVSDFDPKLSENSHRWPDFLPDGKHFLFWARSALGTQNDLIYIGEVGSPHPKPLMKSETAGFYANGRLLFVRGQTLLAQPFNPKSMELSGEPVPVADRIAVNGATVRPIFSLSDNAMLLYQTGETSAGWLLSWLDRDGKQLGAAVKPERYIAPALSPDGKRLATGIFDGVQGFTDIWVFDLTRGTSTRLTFGPPSHSFPVWSSDGKTIFYSSGTNGLPHTAGLTHIFAKAADGSGAERPVQQGQDSIEVADNISADGRYLIYERKTPQTDANFHVWALPLFGEGKPFPVVQGDFDESYAALSPNAKWLAYQSNESGRRDVYITAFPGGGAKWQVSTNSGASPRWRKDGKELFFLDGSDNIVAVDVDGTGTAVQLGVPHILFQAVGVLRDFGPFDVTADGKKFLINTGNLKEGTDPINLVQNWPEELKK
jgi:serine/threonine protein kinase